MRLRDRYYTRWGLYPDQPFVINPPWSSVVAYDLNQGTIKWKVPFGQDAKAAEEGATGYRRLHGGTPRNDRDRDRTDLPRRLRRQTSRLR